MTARDASLARLLRDIVGYGLGNALLKANAFVLVPILTRVMEPATYGAYDLTVSLAGFVGMVASIGMDAAIWRFYFDTPHAPDRQRLLSTALCLQLVISITISAGLVVTAPYIGWILTGSSRNSTAIAVALAGVPPWVVMGIVGVVLRATFRIAAYNFYAVAQFTIATVCSLAVIATGHHDVAWIVGAASAAYVALAAWGVLLIRSEIGWLWSPAWIKPLLSFGLPLVPASVALWILPVGGRFVAAHDIGLSAVAQLALAAKIAAALGLVFGSFQAAWGPYALSVMNSAGAKELYARVFELLVGVGALLASAVCIAAPFLVTVVGTSAYEAAAPLLWWLTFASLFGTAYYVTIIGASILRRPFVISSAVILGALVTLGLASALAVPTGAEGIAAAALAGQVVTVAVPLALTRRTYRLPISPGALAAPLAVGLVLGFVGSHVRLTDSVADMGMRAALFAAVLLTGLHTLHRPAVRSLWRSRLTVGDAATASS